jgi:hypothetical protein
MVEEHGVEKRSVMEKQPVEEEQGVEKRQEMEKHPMIKRQREMGKHLTMVKQ